MTNEEWKRRCANRIVREVQKAGLLRIRELRRRTNYNRGPEEGIAIWYEVLDELAKIKCLVIEKDAEGMDRFVMTQRVAAERCHHRHHKGAV